MAELLPRFNAAMERIQAERAIAKAILEAAEAGEPYPDANGKVYRRSADGHNRDRRRGLPMISKGVGGTSPGTDPLRALLAKEARGELKFFGDAVGTLSSPLSPMDQPQLRTSGLPPPLPAGVEDVVEAKRRRTQVVRLVATVVPVEPHARSIECLLQPIPSDTGTMISWASGRVGPT